MLCALLRAVCGQHFFIFLFCLSSSRRISSFAYDYVVILLSIWFLWERIHEMRYKKHIFKVRRIRTIFLIERLHDFFLLLIYFFILEKLKCTNIWWIYFTLFLHLLFTFSHVKCFFLLLLNDFFNLKKNFKFFIFFFKLKFVGKIFFFLVNSMKHIIKWFIVFFSSIKIR